MTAYRSHSLRIPLRTPEPVGLVLTRDRVDLPKSRAVLRLALVLALRLSPSALHKILGPKNLFAGRHAVLGVSWRRAGANT